MEKKQVIEYLLNPEGGKRIDDYIYDVIGSIIDFADELNIDRDDLMGYMAYMFSRFAECLALKEYEREK